MEIERLNAPYVIEKGEVDGELVQITIRAVDGALLGFDEVREATRQILDYLRRGGSNTVDTVSEFPRAYGQQAAEALDALVSTYRADHGRVTGEYLARLAVAYEALTPEGRGVSTAIADALGKPLPTIKGHIMRARREGYLSEAIQGREGGKITAKARELMAGMQPVEPHSIEIRHRST